jgi:hypothetical protein
MSFAKGYLERILEVKGSKDYREDMLLRITDVYMSSFKKVKALMWFKNVPSQSLLFWHGDETFSLGDKKSRHFHPETMADFVSIMQSYGHELDVNLDNNPIDMYNGTGQKGVDLRLML